MKLIGFTSIILLMSAVSACGGAKDSDLSAPMSPVLNLSTQNNASAATAAAVVVSNGQ